MGSRYLSSSRRRPRMLVFLALAVIGVFAIGLWLGRTSAPKLEKAFPEVLDSTPDSTERLLVNGVPVGYERTEDGAVAAATNFGRVMASVSIDEQAYREAIRTFAAPQWQSEAEDLAENGLIFLAERYGSEGSFTFVPVRYRVASYSDSDARVELWGVTIASGPKIQGIEESWVTGNVELVWVEDDWRVAGQSSETGPTPELLRTEDQRAMDALNGFKEYQRAPAP